MKSSRYNLFLPLEEGGYVVYNTLNDATAILDQETKDCIQACKIRDIDRDDIQKLKDCRIVIEDEVDERRIFEYEYTSRKFKSSVVRFLVLTTYGCNLACPYCYQGACISAGKAMDVTTADDLVLFIQNIVTERRYRRIILGLYGGEPLLNLGCCYRICDKLRPWVKEKSVDLDVILTTNATLLSEDVLDRLSPLASVHATLDGPRHIHDKRRFQSNGEGTYDQIVHVLDLLKERNINTSIRLNIAKDSLSALPSLLQELEEKGFLNHERIRVYTQLISVPCNTGRHEHDLLCIPMNESDSTEDYLWHLGLEWGFEPGYGDVGPCPFVNDWTFAVDPSGLVYKCPQSIGIERYRVGSIGKGGTPSWDYGYYDQLSYDPWQIARCRDCVYLPRCGGGCPKNTQNQDSTRSSDDCEIMARVEKSVLRGVKHKVLVRKREAI